MIRLYSTTIEEMDEELRDQAVMDMIGRETVILCLIGLEYKMETVDMDIEVAGNWIELDIVVEVKDWRNVFKSNMEALLNTEEYELVSLCKQLLKEDKEYTITNAGYSDLIKEILGL